MASHMRFGVGKPAAQTEMSQDDPLVAAGVDRVVAALGLDDLDCFRFLDAHDALTGIVRDIIATARSEVVSDRPEAHDRRD